MDTREQALLGSWLKFILIVAALGIPLPTYAHTVNIPPGNSQALVDAISRANAKGEFYVINLGGGAYRFTTGSDSTDGANALPSITGNITINGSATPTNPTVIERPADASPFRIFHIGPGGTLRLNNLTVTGGFASSNGGIPLSDTGGGILNRGVLRLTDCKVNLSTAELDGGGIETFGSATISGSVIEANTAGRFGGGINNFFGPSGAGRLTVTASVISGNATGLDGGGLENSATSVVRGSTISGNSAGRFGGGVANSGGTTTLELTNSVVSGNTSASGSGIENFSSAVVTANGVSVNANLGGVAGVNNQTDSVFNITSSALTQNASSDCKGTFRSGGSNVVGNARSCRGFENDQVANPPLPQQPKGFAPQITELYCDQAFVVNRGDTAGRFELTAVFTLPGGEQLPVTGGSGTLQPLEDANIIFTTKQGTVPPADCLFAPLNTCILTVTLSSPPNRKSDQTQACGGR